MVNLVNINSEKTFSSRYLAEQINLFRSKGGNTKEVRHSDILAKIEKRFSAKINERKISLVESPDSKGEMRKMYELPFEYCLRILMDESETVQDRCVEVMKEQQKEIERLQVQKPKTQTPSYLIADDIERAKVWIIEAEERKLLQENNEKLQFRSDFLDVCFDTQSMFSMEETVKILKLPFGRNDMMKKLREKKVLTSSNTPLQKNISNGYFKVVESLVENGSFKKLISTTYATQKGIGYIYKLFSKDSLIAIGN